VSEPSRRTDRQIIGDSAEETAARFLEEQGLEVLLRNYRVRLGEIDIVARERDTLAIVEVRSRASALYGGAAASVTWTKQRRIGRAAARLLGQRRDLSRCRVRFDVIVVHEPLSTQPRVEWLQHAFTSRL
jgi:putative endonuclease